MDPYLEKPSLWYGTHNKLIAFMEVALNAVLPPPYFADTEGRCYIERQTDTIRPDIVVSKTVSPPTVSGGVGIATLEPYSPPVRFRIYAVEQEEAYINIIHGEDNQRVVATIELLSHTNKTTRNEGRKLYLEKQEQILASGTHLIEIDLLRAGRHTVAVPESVFRPEHKYNYLVCLHRAGTGGEFDVWLNTLRQRLPRIAIPLDEGIPDVELDLQALFDQNYDAGVYARRIDYTQAPVPLLEGEDATWADVLLREKGLRP
jgi:hypothetical protein